MKHTFPVDPTTLHGILTDQEDIWDNLLQQGHPSLSIPGFSWCGQDPGRVDDAYNHFMEWPAQREDWGGLQDQNGGSFLEIDDVADDGLITVNYEMYDHCYANEGALKSFVYTVTCYVHQDPDDPENYMMTLVSLEITSKTNGGCFA